MACSLSWPARCAQSPLVQGVVGASRRAAEQGFVVLLPLHDDMGLVFRQWGDADSMSIGVGHALTLEFCAFFSCDCFSVKQLQTQR